MQKTRKVIVFVAILLVSTILKVWWIKNIPCTPIYDFETLYRVAVNLFNEQGFTLYGYPWGFQSYGYPLVLSLFFRFMNNCDIFTAKIFNIIISTFTLPIFFLILKRIYSNTKIVWTCFIIAAFLPNHIAYNSVLGTEILASFLFLVVIWLSIYSPEELKYRNIFFQGILCGILSLIKPFFIAYPAVIALVYLIKKEQRVLKKTIALVLGIAVILIPSVIKNYKAFNEIIPISYNGGFTLYINNNSQNVTGTCMHTEKIEASAEFKDKLFSVGYIYGAIPQIEKQQNLRNYRASKIFKDEAVKWIIKHPIEFFTLGLLRIKSVFLSGANDISLWCFDGDLWATMSSQQVRLLKIALKIADTVIFMLGISMFVIIFSNIKKLFSSKTEASTLIILWSLLFLCSVYFTVEGQARYNFPALFLMILTFGMLIQERQ